MIIRQERPEDYDTVYHVVKEAFENAEYTDGNEQNLVAALRKSKSLIPELSLVDVEDEKIVGHILFTKAVVQGITGKQGRIHRKHILDSGSKLLAGVAPG